MDRIITVDSEHYGPYKMRFVGVFDVFKDGADSPSLPKNFPWYQVVHIIERAKGGYLRNPVFAAYVPLQEDNRDYSPPLDCKYASYLPRLKNGQIPKAHRSLPCGSEKELNKLLAKHGDRLKPLCDIFSMSLEEVKAFYYKTYEGLHEDGTEVS